MSFDRLTAAVAAGEKEKEKVDQRLLRAINTPTKQNNESKQSPTTLTTSLEKKFNSKTNDIVFIGNTHQQHENITKFYTFKDRFPKLNPGISRFYNLTSLRIIKSGLKELPDVLGNLSEHGKLVEISFDFNELTEIPDSISHITTLQRLTLSNNKLTTLPFNLGRLIKLQHLNVANNQLTNLPETTRRLDQLCELFIQSNEINVLPSHGDLAGPGNFPSGSGPTALSVIHDLEKIRKSERAAEEFREKIISSESPREIIYWLGRIQEEVIRGAMDGLTLDWLDDVAKELGRHAEELTTEQKAAIQRRIDNKKMLKEAKGMNASELKKELRKRKLDASYSGSRRELVQRLEKFCVDDNKKNDLIERGNWLTDVESKYLKVVSLIAPSVVITMRIWIWNANDLRNADGKYSMSDPYAKVMFMAPYAVNREMLRSRTIRNTLDPNWCEIYTIDLDSRINLKKCSMRYEIWDWDYGGDDADDLLGQVTFQGIDLIQEEKEQEDKEQQEQQEGKDVGKQNNNTSENDVQITSLQDLLEEGKDGKTQNDIVQDILLQKEQKLKENERAAKERINKMLGESEPATTSIVAKENKEGSEVESNNVYRSGPSFLRAHNLSQLPIKKKKKEDGEKKSKKAKTIRVKGTVCVGVRIEPSEAAQAAAQMEQREKAASASAFELWPCLFVADMSHNRLMQLPRGVRGWKDLRRLHLGGNTLSVLPDEFCSCTKMENLNLADNQLVSLPLNFGHLSKLMNLRLDRNKLTEIPESTYTITTLKQLHLADNPLKPIDGIKLWHHGDPILRFKNTAAKLLEVEPTAVRRMEPGTRIFDTTLYTRKIRTDGGEDERNQGPQADHVRFDSILCRDFFSVTGCRYGNYCMFSHIPEPLPVIPYQKDKELMSKEDVRMKTTSHNKKPVHFYGITHDEYDELWKILEEDSADDERSSGSSSDED